MDFKKNQEVILKIDDLGNNGEGIGHVDGYALFVKEVLPGETIRAGIMKCKKNYGFARLLEVLEPSPDRVEPQCPAARPCGGCTLQHLSYNAQLRYKENKVKNCLTRIGGVDLTTVEWLPILGMQEETPWHYRNKAQFPVREQLDENGKPHAVTGFYAGHSHRVIPMTDCAIQAPIMREILEIVLAWMDNNNIPAYNEEHRTGLVRHIYIRTGYHTGQIMVCLVCTRAKLPHSEELVAQLREQFPAIATILLNVNAKNTNVILGSETHPLYGPGYLEDTLCGVPVRLGPLSFYQVNTLAAEQLYGIAAQYAQLTPDDLLLDLYCGMGTIGLSMVDHCRELVGVEIVPEAIESAKANAARMGDAIATKSRFFCADAGASATRLAAEGLRPDVIVLDPPRKGCDEATLSAVVKMNPQRVVYVSCNPATAARDAKWLETQGYRTEKVQPVDLFPRTKHCECVLLMSKVQ